MVSISASEKQAIRKQFPNVPITRTMRGDSKRKHYYMAEEPGPMKLLRRLRSQGTLIKS